MSALPSSYIPSSLFANRLSCLEIYQEHVHDLCSTPLPSSHTSLPLPSLPVREGSQGFFLERCTLIDCPSCEIAIQVLNQAMSYRQIGEHDLNARSSRSHIITEIHIETYKEEAVTRGKMSLVDLAGSERLKDTNSTGKVLQEAGFINRSLYILGKVIAGLVRTNGDITHKDVPYRDSKLTKLLIASLVHSHSLLIACVSEAKGSQLETLRTLKFSMSCACIPNKPVKFLDPQQKIILELKTEIKRLRHENSKLRSNILTAPGHLSHEEGDGLLRVSSAGTPSPERRKNPKNPKMKAVRNPRLPKVKKLQQTRSDIFDNYPQLRNILAREEKEHKSTSRLPVTKALAAAALYEDYDDVPASKSPASKSPVRYIDDLVRIPGAMIFKESVELQPIRQSHAKYEPAQHNLKAMDIKRMEMLEARIRMIEEQARIASTVAAEPRLVSQPQQQEASRALSGSQTLQDQPRLVHEIAVDAEAFIKKPKKRKEKPPAKPSPYLLLQEEMRSKRVEPAPVNRYAAPVKPRQQQEPKEQEVKARSQVPVRPSQHAPQSKGIAMEDSMPEEKKPAAHAPALSGQALRDSIADELAELGLGPIKPTAPIASAASAAKKVVKPVAREGKDKAAAAREKEAKEKHSTAVEKSKAVAPPAARGQEQGAGRGPKAIQAQGTAHTAVPTAATSSSSAAAAKKTVLPVIPIKGAGRPSPTRPQSDKSDRPSPKGKQGLRASIDKSQYYKKKLDELEASLHEKQIEMEDNPGQVTCEVEEEMLAMRIEAKTIRLELARLTDDFSLATASGDEADRVVETGMLAKATAFRTRGEGGRSQSAEDDAPPSASAPESDEAADQPPADPSESLWFFRKSTGSYHHSAAVFEGHDPVTQALAEIQHTSATFTPQQENAMKALLARSEDDYEEEFEPEVSLTLPPSGGERSEPGSATASPVKVAAVPVPTPADGSPTAHAVSPIAPVPARAAVPVPVLTPTNAALISAPAPATVSAPAILKPAVEEDGYEDDYDNEFEALDSPVKTPAPAPAAVAANSTPLRIDPFASPSSSAPITQMEESPPAPTPAVPAAAVTPAAAPAVVAPVAAADDDEADYHIDFDDFPEEPAAPTPAAPAPAAAVQEHVHHKHHSPTKDAAEEYEEDYELSFEA